MYDNGSDISTQQQRYVYQTAITEGGGKVEAGFYVDKRDRETRAVRWERLDEDLAYDPDQLDRQVVTPDQIRTVVRTYRDKVLTEIFPGEPLGNL